MNDPVTPGPCSRIAQALLAARVVSHLSPDDRSRYAALRRAGLSHESAMAAADEARADLIEGQP